MCIVCKTVLDEVGAELTKKEKKSEIKIASAIGEYCEKDTLDSKRKKMVSLLTQLYLHIFYL